MDLFVSVEDLCLSQPIRVMWSMGSSPNHTFSGAGLVLQVINQYLCTFFHQKLTTVQEEWMDILFKDSQPLKGI